MGQSTLMHCSGWMELARVEAASSAALTTWNESRANPFVNEVTLDSQHHWCVLGMTARKCLGMFINRSAGGSVEGQWLWEFISSVSRDIFVPASGKKSFLPNVTVSELWLVRKMICHPRETGTPIPGRVRGRHLSSHCQRTQTHQLRLTQNVSP